MINNISNKEHKGRSGIYLITNTVNGKKYVGRSSNLYMRFCQYIYAFNNRRQDSINEHLSVIRFSFE